MADFFSYVRRLKTLPEYKRRLVAFWSALGVTAVLFFIWLSLFHIIILPASSGEKSEKAIDSPIKLLGASVGEAVTNAARSVQGILEEAKPATSSPHDNI